MRAKYDLPHPTYVWMTADYDISFRVGPEVIWEIWDGDLLAKSEIVRRWISIIETDGARHGRRDDKFFSVSGEDQAIRKIDEIRGLPILDSPVGENLDICNPTKGRLKDVLQ